jgi:O-antigen/teichoic acid export membrane protein
VAQGGRSGAAALTYVSLAGLQRGVSLLILPFVTHVMTPAEYGAASVLSAASLFITAIIAAPLIQVIIRAAARGDENGPALLRAAGTYCYCIVPVAVLPVAAIFTLFVPELLGVAGFIWGIELLAIGFQPAASTFALWVAQARQDLPRFVAISLTSVIATAAAKLVFVVILRLGVLGWAVSDLVSTVLTAIVAVVLVRVPRAKVDAQQIRYLLAFTLPLIPHSAALWALTSLSRPAMAAVSPADQVGLFAFGLNLASVASLVLAESNRAALPHYSREVLPAPTNETLGPVRWQLVAALVVPAIVGSGVALTGSWLFPEPYWPSFAVAGVLLFAQTAYGLYLIPMNYLTQTAGITRYSALASGAGAVVILLGILMFGRRFGALGVAIATSAAFLAMATVALILTMTHKLDIAWHTWLADWPAILSATTALACSIAALASPVGSIQAFMLSGACLILGLGSITLASMRGTST